MDGFNNLRACEMAYNKGEFLQYLEGVGEYVEPPSRYENNPVLNVDTRCSCVNALYRQTNDKKIIDTFKEVLNQLALGNQKQFKISIRYIISQLRLENRNSASFKLDDVMFFMNIKDDIIKQKQRISRKEELDDMCDFVDYYNERMEDISSFRLK